MNFEVVDNVFQVTLMGRMAILSLIVALRRRSRIFLLLCGGYGCMSLGTLYYVLCLMITGSSGGNEDVFGISNPRKACQAQAGLAGIAGFSAQDFSAGKLRRFHILEHGAVKGKAVRM